MSKYAFLLMFAIVAVLACNRVNAVSELPAVGAAAPTFRLTTNEGKQEVQQRTQEARERYGRLIEQEREQANQEVAERIEQLTAERNAESEKARLDKLEAKRLEQEKARIAREDAKRLENERRQKREEERKQKVTFSFFRFQAF